MSAEINALVEQFPRLFHGQQPAVWSDLPQGWFAIAERLFFDLNALLDDDFARAFKVEQIKEKFGGLRVYWSLGPEATLVADIHEAGGVRRLDLGPDNPSGLYLSITERVKQASAEAAETCQRCGGRGSMRNAQGLFATLCNRCFIALDRDQ